MCENISTFVKWAGGKKQLIEQYKMFFPKKIKRYFEPFLGGGAVAFYIIENSNAEEVILSDNNEELINAFNIIKKNVKKLISKLKWHKERHILNPKEYYYSIRKKNPEKLKPVDRAARFIYLNRTCFNGLYRVNLKGGFNVPIGSYKNPNIVQEEKLQKISKLLKKVKLKVMSFEKIADLAKKGDFIYFDPPYYPLKNGKSFTTYTKEKFLDAEQKKLAEVFRKLDRKGCLCMESNSHTKFIKKLYSDYDIRKVRARRLINSNANGRGKINEVVIMNY